MASWEEAPLPRSFDSVFYGAAGGPSGQTSARSGPGPGDGAHLCPGILPPPRFRDRAQAFPAGKSMGNLREVLQVPQLR